MNFVVLNLAFVVATAAASLIFHMLRQIWEWEYRAKVERAIERFKPLPEFPPDGSMWIQSTKGLTWMTQGYYNKESNPDLGSMHYDVKFRPGSVWLVLGSGTTDEPSHFYIDLLEAGETRPVRVMHNRCTMEHFSSVAKDMKRIDDQ